MGKFAKNLNLGKRVLPPPPAKAGNIFSQSQRLTQEPLHQY